MRDLASEIVEYLEKKGIDSAVLVTIVAVLFLVWTIRSLRSWNSLMYYEKWMVVVELFSSALVAIVGFALLLRRLL
jgi:hypothetical protein